MSFKIFLATKNPAKLREIKEILKKFDCTVLLPDVADFPPETGQTFQENALIKASFVGRMYPQHYVAGEDSGLVVPALNGMPGVLSARFAGPDANDGKNIEKLLQYSKNLKDGEREAYFICVIALIEPSGNHRFFEGRLYGRIVQEPSGSNGFGYDPIFEIPEYGKTVAQLSVEEKNKISHRAKAFLQLAEYLEMAV
ncbi:MAG TPA: RdgB/HAM1 family non-canonical purine NTP pyrophosphatase [bacterium]|nr:RdgB/HAM1 family non-canonical purine NTP pyrophosphatase [bacterium]HOL50523.1 RdgB/HAM1 family non-canonical purine NTP pyrophosphatase [bacterium]HXK44787.1 RdgB/HAM1 family non-canonical purine NTP pyrophosphatase [bacterium]